MSPSGRLDANTLNSMSVVLLPSRSPTPDWPAATDTLTFHYHRGELPDRGSFAIDG